MQFEPVEGIDYNAILAIEKCIDASGLHMGRIFYLKEQLDKLIKKAKQNERKKYNL